MCCKIACVKNVDFFFKKNLGVTKQGLVYYDAQLHRPGNHISIGLKLIILQFRWIL